MTPGDRVMVKFDAPGQEEWPEYAGTVIRDTRPAPGPLNPLRTIKVQLDHPPAVLVAYSGRAWFAPSQVRPA